MFVLNGNRKPKIIFYSEIDYSDNPSAFSIIGREKYGNYTVAPTTENFVGYFSTISNKMRNLKFNTSIDKKFKRMIDVLSEEKAESLIILRDKYDAEIIVFTCYEKRNKKLKVSFYIVPKEAIAKIKGKEGLFGNLTVFLKTNYIFPSELVGSTFKREYVEKKVNFSEYKKISTIVTRDKNGKKDKEITVSIKENDNFIEPEKKIYIKESDFPKSGKYKVLLDNVIYIMLVDMEKYGTNKNPFYFLYNPYKVKNI